MKVSSFQIAALASVIVPYVYADCSDRPRVPLRRGKTQSFKIQSNNRQREYSLHIPETYSSTKPSALIFSFHGTGSNMGSQETLSQFSNETVNPNMIAVYPNGEKDDNGERVWDGPTYAADKGDRNGVDDNAFTADLLRNITADYCIDTNRVYATGKSDGGGFVDRLACDSTLRTSFAAFAMCSAALYSDNSRESCPDANPPLPIMEFHGGNDTVIPYTGGKGNGGQIPSITAWAYWWSLRDGCDHPPKVNNTVVTHGKKSENVQHVAYTCKGRENVVNHYKIDGMGHDWPSTRSNSDNKKDGGPTVIDATPLIMDFFNSNSKPTTS